MRIVLATHNAHKVAELRAILGPALGAHELVAYDGPEPVEDGDSFIANALIKARAAHAHSGIPALADDSGIAVDALGGAPGIHSAYYSGSRDSGANTLALLRALDGVSDRAAAYVCAAVFVDGEHEIALERRWPGRVLQAADGEQGFGYDPIFQPDGSPVSAARLTPQQKNEVSHRAQAFRALLDRVLALE